MRLREDAEQPHWRRIEVGPFPLPLLDNLVYRNARRALAGGARRSLFHPAFWRPLALGGERQRPSLAFALPIAGNSFLRRTSLRVLLPSVRMRLCWVAGTAGFANCSLGHDERNPGQLSRDQKILCEI